MATHLIVPNFPFTQEAVLEATDFRNTLDGFDHLYGKSMKDWEVLADPNFLNSLATYWAFIFGRVPSTTETPAKMVTDLLRVTDEQFTARIQNGATPS